MHNADRIPWTLLRHHVELFPPAAAVRVGKKKKGKGGKRTTTANEQAQWGKKKNPPFADHLITIANAIAAALEEDLQLERAKYEVASQRPKRGDIIVSDDIALHITPLVNFWRTRDFTIEGYDKVLAMSRRKYSEWRRTVYERSNWISQRNEYENWDDKDVQDAMRKMMNDPKQHRLCTHNAGFQCGCVLPLSERRARAFIRLPPDNSCYEFQASKAKEFFGALVMQSLIVCGRLEPFYLLGNRHSNLKEWRQGETCQCVGFEHGWAYMMRACQIAYIATNFLLALTSNIPAYKKQGKKQNYRESNAWGMVWKELQGQLQGDAFDDLFVPFLPNPNYVRSRFDVYSIIDYIPIAVSDAVSDTVRSVLRRKGLPVEICDQVLDLVGTRADFSVPHDPLHPDNRRALQNLSDLLWGVIVRCNLLDRKLDRELDRGAEAKLKYSTDILHYLTRFANAVYEPPESNDPEDEDYLFD